MKIYEVIKEAMPDKQTLAKLKQDAQQLKVMSKTGDVDPNKTIPIMQNMAQQAAAMDMGGMVLKFFQTFTTAIKKGIDGGSYGPNELPQMQKAYDEMMAQMPALQKMANDSKKMAVKYGGAGRQDVGEGDILDVLGPAIRNIHMKDPEKEKRMKQQRQKATADDLYHDAVMDLIQSNKGNKQTTIAGFRDMIKNMDGFSDWWTNNQDSIAGKKLMKAVSETATGMGASSIATVSGNVGTMRSRNMYNADGTMKNGLEYGNLLGGKKKPKKNKQA